MALEQHTIAQVRNLAEKDYVAVGKFEKLELTERTTKLLVLSGKVRKKELRYALKGREIKGSLKAFYSL